MNGDILLNTIHSAIDVDTFENAVRVVMELPGFKNAHIVERSDKKFVFGLMGPRSKTTRLYDIGTIENKPLRILQRN